MLNNLFWTVLKQIIAIRLYDSRLFNVQIPKQDERSPFNRKDYNYQFKLLVIVSQDELQAWLSLSAVFPSHLLLKSSLYSSFSAALFTVGILSWALFRYLMCFAITAWRQLVMECHWKRLCLGFCWIEGQLPGTVAATGYFRNPILYEYNLRWSWLLMAKEILQVSHSCSEES